MAASDAKETTMSQQRKDALRDIFRNAPLDIGGDPIEQRTNFRKEAERTTARRRRHGHPGELGGARPERRDRRVEPRRGHAVASRRLIRDRFAQDIRGIEQRPPLSRRVDAKVISVDYRLAP
jgi:hypothetical protein